MTKRKKPLTCPVCKKRFSYSAKAHPIGRLSKHIAKEHPKYKRKKTRKRKQLTSELELADDILLKKINDLKNQYSPRQNYQAEHNVAVGALIEGIMLGIELAKAASKGIEKIKKAKGK